MSGDSFNSFLSGTNSTYIAELYGRYLSNPSAIDQSWQDFFNTLNDQEANVLSELVGASWAERGIRIIGVKDPEEEAARKAAALKSGKGESGKPEVAKGDAKGQQSAASQKDILNSIRALMLIRAYRVRGHLLAELDPLKLTPVKPHPELDPASYGFTPDQYDEPIFIDNVLGLERATLRQIMDVLKGTFCGKIGVEYMHMQDPDRKSWVQQKIESTKNRTAYSKDEKITIYTQLAKSELFERFLHTKFPGTKRFGLDGGESTIPAIEAIMYYGSQLGLEEVVFGMAHRGRLNVLSNVMGKEPYKIFSEFQGTSSHPEDVQGSGDVKYHLGTSSDRTYLGKNVHLSLTANPSHLEAVNPVTIGKVRAKQDQKNDEKRNSVLGILLHGDAAFAGQGVVAEGLLMSELKGYQTGGTIHIIVNNQIGFTTVPIYSRSGNYATDIAKMIQAPILHVNGDHPEAVVHVSKLAIEYRQKFGSDIVIDLFCYRRHGHNEGDEPSFTQPLMYKAIADHKSVLNKYREYLISSGGLTETEIKQIDQGFLHSLERDFEKAKGYKPDKADWLEGKWAGLSAATGKDWYPMTGLPLAELKELGGKLSVVPKEFKLHSKITRQLEAKAALIASGENIDWATGEALAFASLVKEGIHVRLSGQDCGRGTFSQRHAIMYDQETEARYVPLNRISEKQAKFEVHDSPLSEYGVLGFEYGYSLADPQSLVLWEAQFGDFANGAQIMIDQFIASGEVKWLRMSGLTMLLPHGMEGNGPEHSSARLERFLQLCAEENMQVANISTPANYFHALRRQVKRNFRKPLVIMTPKSLLRHKLAVSSLKDMADQTRFLPVIGEVDKIGAGSKIQRVVLCSGKVYYDLLAKRREEQLDQVALIRLEEFYPFPAEDLKNCLNQYPNAEIVWCQEEHRNNGAWFFVSEFIEEVLVQLKHKSKRPIYVGRAAAASPATGSMKRHTIEQDKLIAEALNLKQK